MSGSNPTKTRNILFIMCDQLRADHLSCLGHPSLQTPHIDALAARGVNFERAYVQSGVCGPSRMSFYTGRYMYSHGATWNGVPLSAREKTLGDYLRPAGIRTALVGKTHVIGDEAALERFGIEAESERALLLRQGGFEPVNRHEGHAAPPPQAAYQAYLKAQGYDCDDPWSDYVCAAEGPDGELCSGWRMRHAGLAARVAERHSETAYSTDQAIQFISDQGEAPWLLHLSYIKPHWPYLAPAPYHDMFGPEDCTPVLRNQSERDHPHPVTAAYFGHPECQSFARDEVIATVKPTYMGLVKQLDDHIGRLMAALEAAGRLDDTMIVFTSDHGDYLGDHNLIGKGSFFEGSIHVPLIVRIPGRAGGQVIDELVALGDISPSLLQCGGSAVPDYMDFLPLPGIGLDGRGSREYLFGMMNDGWMAYDGRWKLCKYATGEHLLFDLAEDPTEQRNLLKGEGHRQVRDRLDAALTNEIMRSVVASHHDKVVSGTDLSSDLDFGEPGWKRVYPRPL